MKTKNFELYEFLNTSKNFIITATDLTGSSQTIITSDNAVKYMLHKYGTRKYHVIRGLGDIESTDAFNDFNEDYRLWVTNRQHNIDKLYQSMFDYDYSPIENVDRYESETTNKDIETTYGKRTTESGTTSNALTESVEETHENNVIDGGTDTTIKNGQIVNDTQRAGFNSPNSYTPAEKNTETYTQLSDQTNYGKTNRDAGEVETSKTATDTTTHGKILSDSGTDSTDDDTIRTLRVHGNIGVTSNVDLLQQEENYRLQSLAEILIDEFINDYTFYA